MSDPAINVRAAFREVTLGLMEWRQPPAMTPREYRRAEGLEPESSRGKETHYGRDTYVDPYDVDADWEETA